MARRPPRRISCHPSKTHHVSRSGRRRRRAAAGLARRCARGVGEKREARRSHRPGDAAGGSAGVGAGGDPAGGRVERGSMERAIGGRGGCNSDWRPRGARGRRGAAAAGSGDVSRHRDLGRQHRHSRGPVSLPAAPGPSGPAQLGSHRHRDADRVRPRGGRRIVGGPRRVDGRDLLHSAAVRSPDAARQRRGAGRRDSVLRRSAAGRRCRLCAHLRGDARHSRRHVEGHATCSRHRHGSARPPRSLSHLPARKSRCCRSARSCSRASPSPGSSSTSLRFR